MDRGIAHLHLLSRSVSKTHALLISTEAGVYIRDLASRTHVLVNGKSVIETFLHNGDRLQIGSFTFRFADPSRKLPRHAAAPPQCSLEVDGSSLAIAAEGRTILIGRRSTCDITLTEPSVSICHAVIFELNGKHYIRDLGSRTGTFVNGNTIHQHPLNFGDAIRIGETDMQFVPAGHQRDIDELEDLVGTASLDEESIPLLPPQKIAPAAPIQVTAAQTSADDLIPLASEDITQDVAEPSGNEVQVTTSAPLEPVELDLANDPDVAGPDDTAPLPPARLEPAAEPPVLSPRIVEHSEAVDLHAEMHGDDNHSQLLVDANLHEERMTGSGTFVEVEAEPEESENQAGQSIDISAPANDFGLEFHDGLVQSEGPSLEVLSHPVETSDPPSVVSTVFDEPSAAVAPTQLDAPVDSMERSPVDPQTAVGGISASAESIAAEPQQSPAPEIVPEVESIELEPSAMPAEAIAPIHEAESVAEQATSDTTLADDYPPVTVDESAACDEVDLSSSDFRLGSQSDSESSNDAFFEESPASDAGSPTPLLELEVRPPQSPPPVKPLIDVSALIPPLDQEAVRAEAENPISSVGDLIEPDLDEATEVIDVTEPTPESAQELESAYPGGAPLSEEESAAILAGESPLTDSTFGRDVREFSGSGLGALVEPTPASPMPEPSESILVEQPDLESPALEMPETVDVRSASLEGLLIAAEPAPEIEPEFSFEDLAEQVLASEESLEEPTEFGEEIGFVTEDAPPVSGTPFDQQIEPALDLTTPPPLPQFLTAPTGATEIDGDELIELEEDADAPLALDSPGPQPPQTEVPISAESGSQPSARDPFFGMSRDSASFIGGVPLVLPPAPILPFADVGARNLPLARDAVESLALSAANEELPETTTDFATPEAAPGVPDLASDPLISESLETLTTEESIDFSEGEETIGSFLSRLEASEPPAELFESTPDALDALPDSMGTLTEITDVLGEHAGPANPSLEKWDSGMPQLIDEVPGPLRAEPDLGDETVEQRPGDILASPVSEDRLSETPAAMSAAPAALPARPPPPRVPAPPPRATRMRAHSRPLNTEAPIADGDPDSITIPPFEGFGPATEGQVTTAFDGLAMPPVREVDIFSQNLNPGLGGGFGAASSPAGTFGAATGAATAAGLVGLAAVGVDALASPRSELASTRGRRAGGGRILQPPRQSFPAHEPIAEHVETEQYRRTISPQFAPPAPPKASRRRRFPLGWLLPLMILLAGASVAAIWYGVRSEGTAQASLRFENLNHLTEAQRSDFERHERDLLMKPDLRVFARQFFENNLGGHGGTGLLYPGLNEEKLYSALVDNTAVPPNSQHLLIRYASTDPRLRCASPAGSAGGVVRRE